MADAKAAAPKASSPKASSPKVGVPKAGATKAGVAKTSVAKAGATKIRVTQVRSAIGAKPKHRGTLRALGLGRIGKENILPDSDSVRGMLRHVSHLVRHEPVKAK